MKLFEVTLTGNVTGKFKVIADDHETALDRATLMYRNGIDHFIESYQVVLLEELDQEAGHACL
jgi:hypothetical protein